MAVKRKISVILLNAAIFIAMEIAAIGMIKHNGEAQNFFLSKWSHAVMAKLWGGTESVRDYFLLRKHNEELAQENYNLGLQLKQAQLQLDQYLTENFVPDSSNVVGGFLYGKATIAKISRNKQHNYIIIDKGRKDGVTSETGIITPSGVIGIVDAVGENYSYAVSLMNTNLSVSARIGSEGGVGPLSWDGKSTNGAVLKEIPLQVKFHAGDTVYTSGYSNIFPSGIPIGEIEGSKIVNGATYDIQVRLFQDFNSVRYVTLVTNVGKKEIEELEKAEEKEEE